MATLTRPRSTEETAPTVLAGVPAPFPVHEIQRSIENPFEGQADGVEDDVQSSQPLQEEMHEGHKEQGLNELLPSISNLQRSCLMTLNNLLESDSDQWRSIVPDRRHSMPNSAGSSSFQQPEASSSSSALQTLVSNLRTRLPDDNMIEIRSSETDTDLLFELRERIGQLSPTLSPRDAALAKSLVTLLSYFDRLSTIQTSTTPQPSGTPSRYVNAPPPIDVFDALTRHLNDVQLDRLASQTPSEVESTILWTQIDRELENVVTMCKERTEGLPRFYQENLPPQYDFDELYDVEALPEYDGTGRLSLDEHKSSTKFAAEDALSRTSTRINDEKMRLDLEGVAMAIDRLYLVAPQLHNQRVELKTAKMERLAELEKARKAATAPRSKKGKEKDVRELESILEMLGKASERTLKDQAVVLDGGMQSRLERAKERDLAKRDAFVEGLLKHSDAGRMHAQDAVLQPKVKDPQAMLTLPEFIREAIPPDSDLLKDPSIMLSLPEFVAQVPPPEPPPEESKKSRHRSLSAPPRSWLRHSKSSLSLSISSSKSGSASKQKNKDCTFDVVYVAENHENLHHVLVFFTVTKQMPGVELTAEVLPPFPEHHSEGGDHLIIRSGLHASLPLMLPARTTPGKKEVRAQSGHFEIKLPTIRPPSSTTDDPDDSSSPLLDATQLSTLNPTSFLCASCSLPLIYSNKVKSYRDLPSEHWEELVEAWMCHADQKLHDQVIKHGKAGFWPQPDQAFVGGSYILFEAAVMAQQNMLAPQNSTVSAYFIHLFVRSVFVSWLFSSLPAGWTIKKTGVGYPPTAGSRCAS
ncbi:hypothetical protein CC2G_014206 [Coprinopsis cinerea AmutBmut pab1-1]|nr:hypothetical protein CC2G_014206 [Coprinopsis cinerea AmutBmut pab1-1]